MPVTRNSCGIVSPEDSSAAAISDAITMKTAFRMLLAATIRATCVFSARLWISA